MRWKPIFPREEKFDSLPDRTQRRGGPPPSSPCRKAATSSARSASCLIRAAANIRGPSRRSWRKRRHLVARGAREITLLGQNVNAYRGEGPDGEPGRSRRCLIGCAKIEGLARLRYTTSHPRDMGDDLIAAHGDTRQADAVSASAGAVGFRSRSGRDEPAAYVAMTISNSSSASATRVRTSRCRPTSSSAFPARRDKDFEATLALVRDVGFAQAFSFKYSARPGTPAAAARKQVPDDVKIARLAGAAILLVAQQAAFNASLRGQCHAGAVRKAGSQAGQAIGRSPYLQPVHVERRSRI